MSLWRIVEPHFAWDKQGEGMRDHVARLIRGHGELEPDEAIEVLPVDNEHVLVLIGVPWTGRDE